MYRKLARGLTAAALAASAVVGVGVVSADAHTATTGRKHYNFSCKKSGGTVTYSGAMDIDQTKYADNSVNFQNPTVAWSTSPSVHADKIEWRVSNSVDDRITAYATGGTIDTLNDVAYSGNGSRIVILGTLDGAANMYATMLVWDNGGNSTQCTDQVLAK